MRRYEWTRGGMVRNDADGGFVNATDAEAERAGLLAALKGALTWLEGVKRENRDALEDGQPPRFGFAKIRAAIAKAEGNPATRANIKLTAPITIGGVTFPVGYTFYDATVTADGRAGIEFGHGEWAYCGRDDYEVVS